MTFRDRQRDNPVITSGNLGARAVITERADQAGSPEGTHTRDQQPAFTAAGQAAAQGHQPVYAGCLGGAAGDRAPQRQAPDVPSPAPHLGGSPRHGRPPGRRACRTGPGRRGRPLRRRGSAWLAGQPLVAAAVSPRPARPGPRGRDGAGAGGSCRPSASDLDRRSTGAPGYPGRRARSRQRGDAPDDLLASYQAERHAAGHRMLM